MCFHGACGARITMIWSNGMKNKKLIWMGAGAIIAVVLIGISIFVHHIVVDFFTNFPPRTFGIGLKYGSVFGYRDHPDVLYYDDKDGNRQTIQLDHPVSDRRIVSSENHQFVYFRSGDTWFRGEPKQQEKKIDSFQLKPVLERQELSIVFPELVPITLDEIVSVSNDGKRVLAVMSYGRHVPGCPEGNICGGNNMFGAVVVIDVFAKKGRLLSADDLTLLD
jgi:hypothetical protein